LIDLGACELSTEMTCDLSHEKMPLSTMMYRAAAVAGNLLTIKYLHETVQCAWDAYKIALGAVDEWDASEILQYLFDQGVRFDHNQKLQLMMRAGLWCKHSQSFSCLKWLRAHGAPWPSCMGMENEDGQPMDWTKDVVAWAKLQGCKSPLQSKWSRQMGYDW
jgi:hypothetical protein